MQEVVENMSHVVRRVQIEFCLIITMSNSLNFIDISNITSINIRGGGGPCPLPQEALCPRAVPKSRFTKLLLVPLEEPVEEELPLP